MIHRYWPWLAAAGAYVALAVARLWPLARDAGHVVTLPGDDVLLTSWIGWRNVTTLPFTNAWWNAPIFYPAEGAMSFSELLLGQLPIAAPVHVLSQNPVLANNVNVLLALPLCALAAHALAFDLTRRHDAATLAALAFGFGAMRANHIGHVQMLSYYWAPVALLCLHRSLPGPRATVWLAGAATAFLMQVLCNLYTLFQLPLLVLAWIVWFPSTLRQRAAALAALGVGLLPMVPVLLQYRSIHATYGFTRTLTEARQLSADIGSLFQAHPQNVLLGHLISSGSGVGFFPGVTVVGLLIVAAVVAARGRVPAPTGLTRDRVVLLIVTVVMAGIAASPAVFGPWAIGPLTVSHSHKPLSLAIVAAIALVARGPSWRRVWQSRSPVGFYAVTAAFFFVLSFGPEPRLWGERVFYQSPYALLMRLPGFGAIRGTDRMALLGVLCLAVVVALTYARWANALKSRRRIVWLALCAGLALDGWFRLRVQPVPAPGPSDDWRDVRAVVELPLSVATDASAMYRSMRAGPPLINGASGYTPAHYLVVREASDGDLSLLPELVRDGSLGVAIDRTSPDHDQLERTVARLKGATLRSQTGAWTTYSVPHTGTPHVALGPAVDIAGVRTRSSSGDATRMVDGRIDTVWPSPSDNGDEHMTVELRELSRVAAVRLDFGTTWLRFPREISVEASADGMDWSEVWSGRAAVMMLRSALHMPRDPPMVVTFNETTARFLRFRLQRSGPDEDWTIGELSIHGPPARF
jgi:hypothetical protein